MRFVNYITFYRQYLTAGFRLIINVFFAQNCSFQCKFYWICQKYSFTIYLQILRIRQKRYFDQLQMVLSSVSWFEITDEPDDTQQFFRYTWCSTSYSSLASCIYITYPRRNLQNLIIRLICSGMFIIHFVIIARPPNLKIKLFCTLFNLSKLHKFHSLLCT